MRVMNQVIGTTMINVSSRIGAYSIKGNDIPVSTAAKIPTIAVAKWLPK
jgi:hypothetical protein